VCRRLERKESALVRIPVVVTQKINFADPFLPHSRIDSCSPLTLGGGNPTASQEGEGDSSKVMTSLRSYLCMVDTDSNGSVTCNLSPSVYFFLKSSLLF